ncbi:NitT/TauT family transport system permease protein [Paenibacillus sp. V4I3]|uniref:ABC transporter permease n=1 Tax=unclassified Paenibacillus TaxID=185978 RepID=UPI0027883C8A|nr:MULTISPECIES: ABC transporter permease [unclassified Paenibacillus]MDQ0876080.1 NitT/TauT family transport system permease protein [Paenibacillus sp. V4I3]MDQ0887971.1 NitT/TauT family transport system permease protein [Paenibacillus sp. V4I9]
MNAGRVSDSRIGVEIPLSKSLKHNKRVEFFKLSLIRLVLLIIFLGSWQYASGRFIDKFWISTPLDIMKALQKWIVNGELFFHLGITAEETLLGFFIGALSGGIVGFFLGRWTFGAKIFEPFIMALYSLPKVALAPLFILWFGIGIEMKIMLSAVTVFFLVFINTFAGVRDVDNDQLESIRIMGATERQILSKVVFPSALNWIIVGLKLSVPYALLGAIVGEITASNRGIGYLIQYSAGQFNTAGTFAALITLIIVSSFLNYILSLFEKRFLHWKTPSPN